ncbi:hypothetical protein GCM10011584_35240 [Nocardioides phosphati]|jgi:hypothetical protein|uniref:Uncharacterized protein n=1 Tax=Nocardioides phosphati TaxID=1867775 RepID=A0ABQ2NH01_9ACTN|nr:hypothetical protein [Nocardioides phosphati]GGO94368.1 hypothetical protein GCM10011584_35240 [Nocardioides phosphati]
MTTPRAELERHLGGPLSPGLAALSDADIDALAKAIVDATRSQKQALAAAIDNGLDIVPRVLRGAVKKALFG